VARIEATLNSPFEVTMTADSDTYACPGFEGLFDAVDKHHLYAASIAPALFADTKGFNGSFRADFPPSYASFPERNLGLQILVTGNPKVIELLALFRDVFLRHLRQNVRIHGDQASFREALFTMRIFVHDVVLSPRHVCRFVLGCDDGCRVVHRKFDQDKSGNNVRPKTLGVNDVTIRH